MQPVTSITAGPGGRRRCERTRIDAAPFAHCALRSVRLLVGFTLLADEAADSRDFLLRASGLGHATACDALFRMTAAVRGVPAFGGTFDASLARVLGGRAAAFERRCVASLAEHWSQRAGSLRGPDLAAFVWWLARDPEVGVRPLEREVVRSLEPVHLLSHARTSGPWAPLRGGTRCPQPLPLRS